jgi:hypothetical protein
MKKLLMAGALAFVVSLAMATGIAYKVRQQKPATVSADAHADSLRADSLRAGAPHADSRPAAADSHATKGAAAVATAAGPNVDAKAPDGHGVATPSSPGITAAKAPGAAPSPAAPTPAAPSVEQAAAFKQLGKILGSMKPDDAAKVLAFLSDAEVEGVLHQIGPKQAAGILTSLPSQRAGAISRRLLVVKPGGAR